MESLEPAFDALDQFRFRGDRLCLDFIATLGFRSWPEPVERLTSHARLCSWIEQAGLLPGLPLSVGAGGDLSLLVVVTLRESMYRLVHAHMVGEPLDPADLEITNRWAALPDLAPQLTSGGNVTVSGEHELVERALSTVARDAIVMVATVPRERVKECAREDCTLLFHDASPAGKRRWCSMQSCGNRSKTYQYRRRVAARAAEASVSSTVEK